MLSFLLFLLSPFLALAGVTNMLPPAQQVQTTYNANYSFTSGCWYPESNVTLTVSETDLDRVHNANATYQSRPVCYGDGVGFNKPTTGVLGNYIRVRQQLRIAKLKTDTEGEPFYGGCELGDAIRLIGQTADGKKIWWEDKNYTGGKLFDLVFIEAYPDDEEARYFDVYARDSVVDDPEGTGYGHLKECKTSGGIVPVVEETKTTVPPQTIAFRQADGDKYNVPYMDKTGYLSNYCRFTNNPIDCPSPTGKNNALPTAPPTYRLFPDYKYYIIKIAEEEGGVPKAAERRGQIGKLNAADSQGKNHPLEVFFHAGTFYVRDTTDGVTYKNPSLQLGVLQFRTVDEWNPYIPVCKPAIYLYPEETTNINVKLDLDGKLTESIPTYDSENGWNVKAEPDGKIEKCNNVTMKQCNNYDYLYYEADIKNITVPKDGWVIQRSAIGDQLSDILTKLGLNEKESRDFLEYWVPKLSEKPYYFMTLMENEELNNKEKLIFSQNPDTLIRVRFLFEGLDRPIDVKPLNLPETPERVGFTAVDWGGGVINGSCDAGHINSFSIK